MFGGTVVFQHIACSFSNINSRDITTETLSSPSEPSSSGECGFAYICGTSYFTSIKGSARPVVHQFSYKECVRRRVRVSKHNRVRGDPSGTHVEVGYRRPLDSTRLQ